MFFGSLASYATNWKESKGRYIAEPASETRTPFQRDRDRIIHSSSFRRLKQKTQVFVAHEGDHYRTRLTHSLEVAQIARSIARSLHVDEDLAEALALAHDLGHPPFGHAGEDQLDDCMKDYEGFDHNAQALRIVTLLEQRYPNFDGLNLTWEMLEGLAKHNGPVLKAGESVEVLPVAFKEFKHILDLEPTTHAGIEAQIAALSDDIAYNNHDIDDGVWSQLISIADLKEIDSVGEVFRQVETEFPDIDERRRVLEAVRRLIGIWVTDLVEETNRRIHEYNPQSAIDVRELSVPLVGFSEVIKRQLQELRSFLSEKMYNHYKVNRMRSRAKRILRELFDLYLKEPETLPSPWREQVESGSSDTGKARLVCDYIAGMTDSFAINEHRRLFNLDSMQ